MQASAAPRADAEAASGAAGMGASSGNSTATTLSQIYEMVYTTSCAVCHSMAPNDAQNGKLGMIRSKDQLHAALVDKPAQGAACAGKGTYVVPGDPEMSLLMHKLSVAPSCGSSMPLGGMAQLAHVEMFRAWIAAGALNN